MYETAIETYLWLLEHFWWVATLGPYFGFNYWLVWRFQKDEGPISLADPAERALWLLMVFAGVWAVLYVAAISLADQIRHGVRVGTIRAPELRRVRAWS